LWRDRRRSLTACLNYMRSVRVREGWPIWSRGYRHQKHRSMVATGAEGRLIIVASRHDLRLRAIARVPCGHSFGAGSLKAGADRSGGNPVSAEISGIGFGDWGWGSLGSQVFGGERLVQRRFHDVRRRRGSFLLDLGKQPGLNRSDCPLSLHIIMGETAGPEDYRAQLSDAAATSVVEVHKA
jgi:hypothetical protein